MYERAATKYTPVDWVSREILPVFTASLFMNEVEINNYFKATSFTAHWFLISSGMRI